MSRRQFSPKSVGAKSKYPPSSFNSNVGSPLSSNLNKKNSGSGPKLKSVKPKSSISLKMRFKFARGSPSNGVPSVLNTSQIRRATLP